MTETQSSEATVANPALSVPGALDALQALATAAGHGAGLPETTLRVGPPEGQPDQRLQCLCPDARTGPQEGRRERRSDLGRGRLAGRPYFTEAERAALRLTEAVTPAQRPRGPGAR